jgi:hypothetical protein
LLSLRSVYGAWRSDGRSGLKGPEFVWSTSPGGATASKLKSEQSKEIPTLSAAALKATSQEFEGRVVRLQFSYRGDELQEGVGMLYDLVPKVGYTGSETSCPRKVPRGIDGPTSLSSIRFDRSFMRWCWANPRTRSRWKRPSITESA